MGRSVPEPTGLGRRARRLSDQETAERMLRTAVEMINRTGLTVSLDHLSFEDVIREAGVARTAVYRHWPYKDLFFSDVVTELAKAAIPSPTTNEAIVDLIRRVVAEHPRDLTSPSGRHGVLVELIRQAALADMAALHGPPHWRTYLALHATFLSLADGDLRDRVQEILRRSEQGFVERVAAASGSRQSRNGLPSSTAGFARSRAPSGAITSNRPPSTAAAPVVASSATRTRRRHTRAAGEAGIGPWSLCVVAATPPLSPPLTAAGRDQGR
jgi:AcrR family transcriptional regulator